MGLFTKAVSTLASNLGLSDPELYRWMGTQPSHSGERVSVDTALTLDAVWACARLVSQTIATLPLPLYRRDEQRRSTPATEHPLYRVIHDQPNADMTSVDFWQAMVACKLLWGNGYAEIIRGANRRVISLEPMRSDRVQVTNETDGSRTYRYTYNGIEKVLQEDDVLHLKGFSLDGKTGLSAIAAGRNSLGTALGAERTAGSIFKHGMRPSGYFKIPQFLSKENRTKARAYVDSMSGAENTGKVPMVEGGWEFTAMSIPPNDAQLLETRAFNVETICRWFGVAPPMIGHMEKASAWGTGLEQMNLWFLTYTLRAHLKEIEQAIWSKCLSAADRQTFYPEFNVDGLLRGDSKGRAELYQSLVTNGLRTPNELRALDNEPPLPGGDKLMIQGAMTPLDTLNKQAEANLKGVVAENAAAVEAAKNPQPVIAAPAKPLALAPPE
jgi:HK97 family phage portal protein